MWGAREILAKLQGEDKPSLLLWTSFARICARCNNRMRTPGIWKLLKVLSNDHRMNTSLFKMPLGSHFSFNLCIKFIVCGLYPHLSITPCQAPGIFITIA